MTLFLLALDALDAGLVEHFDVDAFRLESYGEIETFARTQDDPFTPEVWATVATGLDPDEHGVTGAGTSEWDNPMLDFASKFTGGLSESVRGKFGKIVREQTGERERLGETESETVFDRDDAVVHNWPGVYNGAELQRAWDLMNAVSDGKPQHEFERELFGLAAEQFGWIREMGNHDISLAGVHVHALDAAGHAYADDEESLEHVYRRVGDFVTELLESMDETDELLLLSDHGMRTTFYEDEEDGSPASHSWRAYASATTEEVPESVFEVREWVENRIVPSVGHPERDVEIDKEQLRDLGYV